MLFNFSTARRITFGPGTCRDIPDRAGQLAKHAMVVCGKSTDRIQPVIKAIEDHGVETTLFSVSGEPEVGMIGEGARLSRQARIELVIGIGGGSVLDAAKAIAALSTNTEDITTYLEVIGEGRPLIQEPLPWIAVPTTAGTGAEVTCNSVIASPEHRVKVSLRHESMFACLAVVDPELTHSMPSHMTAATGLDALTQLMEAYVSINATPMTDALCLDGIRRAGRALPRVMRNGNDANAREDMALAALFSGMALANAKLGAVHGIAGPLGGMFPMAHGAACGLLLADVMDANIRALISRDPNSPALSRYDEISRILTGSATAKTDDGIRWTRDLIRSVHLPRLSEAGMTQADIPALAQKAKQASSMKGNPIQLKDEELETILGNLFS